MASTRLDRERNLPWEVLAQLGPTVTGAVFFSKAEAMKLIEEALLDKGKSVVGQGSLSTALRLPTEQGSFIAKWIPAYDPLSQTSSVAAFSRWKDLYARKGLPDPAPFLLPTQAIQERKGWWIIQPVVQHPATLAEEDPKRVRGVSTETSPGEFKHSKSPLSQEVLDIERQIEAHPVLGKKDPSGASRFAMIDVEPDWGWQNVGLDPRTKKPVLYDLGTLLNLEAKPREGGRGIHRGSSTTSTYSLKQRRLPATFKKAGGGAAGLGIGLLLGALGNLVGGGDGNG